MHILGYVAVALFSAAAGGFAGYELHYRNIVASIDNYLTNLVKEGSAEKAAVVKDIKTDVLKVV